MAPLMIIALKILNFFLVKKESPSTRPPATKPKTTRPNSEIRPLSIAYFTPIDTPITKSTIPIMETIFPPIYSSRLDFSSSIVKINGETLWGPQIDNKLIAPIDTYSVQVHHFKWDSTCVERIKAVADIKKEYAYSKEYLKMYQAIRRNNFEIEINTPEFMIEDIKDGEYTKWKELIKKIVTI